ncbi:hypothetical protein AALD74_22380 [Lachnospiraceae bacterium 48-21]
MMIGADWKSTEIIRCPQGAQRPVDVGSAPTVAVCQWHTFGNDRNGVEKRQRRSPRQAQCTTSLSGV